MSYKKLNRTKHIQGILTLRTKSSFRHLFVFSSKSTEHRGLRLSCNKQIKKSIGLTGWRFSTVSLVWAVVSGGTPKTSTKHRPACIVNLFFVDMNLGPLDTLVFEIYPWGLLHCKFRLSPASWCWVTARSLYFFSPSAVGLWAAVCFSANMLAVLTRWYTLPKHIVLGSSFNRS